MSSYYTVRLERKMLISKLVGKTWTRETKMIEEVYSDLPYQTAMTYKTMFPEANVRIEQQYREIGGTKPSVRVKGESRSDIYRKPSEKLEKAPKVEEKPILAPKADYASVVNAMMEKT